MLSIGAVNEHGVLAITASGKLTLEDYVRTLPVLETMLQSRGSLKFYIELSDFEGFEIGAIWEDIKFDFRNHDKIGKTVVVGESKWEEYGTRFSDLFFAAKLNFFYKEQKADAWRWINADS